MNFLEKDMENLILKDPKRYLDEDGLKLISSQYSIGNYRFDLLFEDRHGAKLIVEIQRGTLDRNHTYKIFDYYDEYKERNPDDFLELMVVANKIPRERRDRLKSKGVAFKEIPQSVFLEDPNFQEETIQENTEKNSEPQYFTPNLDNDEGRKNFENLLSNRKDWKKECFNRNELTDHRREQLIDILKKYRSFEIPFFHFNNKNINISTNSNSQIYPIICAYYKGYFDRTNESLLLKNNYIEEFQLHFTDLVEEIFESVIRPIEGKITEKKTKKYISIFLNDSRFMHFRDQDLNNLQLHVEKKYLSKTKKNFDLEFLKKRFSVHETKEDYVLKISDAQNLDFLSQYFIKLFN